MRTAAIVLAALIAGCSPAEAPDETPVADMAVAGFEMEPAALVGVWSFDRSCASGDGMRLSADDTASFDEWGQGNWATADGDRIVLTLERHEPGVGATGHDVTYYFDVAAPVTDELIGQIARDDGTEQRAISARRCPG
jgi:hypothetical protein